ncbi:MAG: alkaline phosphatase family protein [Kineosporiaceae bacterium]
MTGAGSVWSARAAAVEALTTAELAPIVDLVAHPDEGEAVVVANAAGAARLTPGGHEVLHGRDPVANTDPLAFLPYEVEVSGAPPANEFNAYPDPYRRLASFFADPGRSPDLVVVHTPAHYFPDQGGHLGEHGSLDVVQSRAPFLLSGAGVQPRGRLHDWSRVVDVTPTLLHALGVPDGAHRHAAGAPFDGRAREDLVAGGARWTIGLLWDGAHCQDLLALAADGELPGVAALLERGLALEGGAVAEFPSVTLCNHTSALTGVGPGRHGILGNVFVERDSRRTEVPNDATTWHRSAQWLRPGVATVFEALRAARPEATSVCVNEAIDRGADVSTMQLVRAGGGADGAAGLDAALPAAEASPFVGCRAHLGDDYYRWCTRVDDAGLAQVLQAWPDAASAPALTWWSAVVTDAGHHGGGPRSAMARDSLRDADRRLQMLLDHLQRLGVLDDVTFLLTADHGFEAADPQVRGSWRPALEEALDPAGVAWQDAGPGFVYLWP